MDELIFCILVHDTQSADSCQGINTRASQFNTLGIEKYLSLSLSLTLSLKYVYVSM